MPADWNVDTLNQSKLQRFPVVEDQKTTGSSKCHVLTILCDICEEKKISSDIVYSRDCLPEGVNRNWGHTSQVSQSTDETETVNLDCSFTIPRKAVRFTKSTWWWTSKPTPYLSVWILLHWTKKKWFIRQSIFFCFKVEEVVFNIR